jgi:hypothetical protein
VHREAIERLKLFVEKVERLQSLSLVGSLVERGSRLTFSWTAESGALTLAAAGPEGEQVEAFVLTMRLFMQDNDQISLRNMARLYEGLPVAEELRKYFAMHRANLNQSLEARCMLSVNGDHPTRREVLETVLYGQLSHLTPSLRERYLSWVQVPMAGAVIDFEFVGVLVLFLRTLGVMAEICRRALAELQVAPPSAVQG